MREIVGVLRYDDAPTSPQPTLTSLRALVLRDKGDDARLTVEGSPRVLPAGVELSAYRIVEHLLSALDDAPGVEVGVRFGEEALEIRVSGPAGRRGDVGARWAVPASARSCTAARSTPGPAAAAPRRSPCCPSRPLRDVARAARIDVLIGAPAALFGAAGTAVWQGPLACVAAAALGAALGLYRRYPVVASVLAVAAAAALVPTGDLAPAPAILVCANAFAAGRWTVAWASTATALALLAATFGAAVVADNADGWLVPAILLVGTAWIAGRAIRERDLVAARLAERAEELEREREQFAALSVRYERARIASSCTTSSRTRSA